MVTSLPDILASVPSEGLGLEELTALANRALESRSLVVDDGRTSDRVDARTIRFYQTLAIVPKPEYEGRRAVYQREHLVRVVAAKQLQSEGFTLAQIQSTLPTRTFDELASALFEFHGAQPSATPLPSRVSAEAPCARPSTLVAFELIQGVTVLIDPTVVAHIDALALALTRTAQSHAHQPHIGGIE